MRMIITEEDWDAIDAIANPVTHAQLDTMTLAAWQKSSLDYGGRPQFVTQPHRQYWLCQRLWLAAQRVQGHVAVDLSTGIQVRVSAPVAIVADEEDYEYDRGCVEMPCY